MLLRTLGRRGGAEQPGTAFVFEVIGIAFDVHRRRVVEQPIEDGARE